MKRADAYIVEALEAAEDCGSIPQARDAGSRFGEAIGAEVVAQETEVGQKRASYRFALEDAFQHAVNLAPARSTIQVFLDAALSALTDELRG